MRFLHTADWHVNDRLGRIDRTSDLRAAVERIAGLCETENVDVLLVAGDLFSELARPEALRETIHHWQTTFRNFFSRGGTILACTGNHDSETFCQTLRSAMSLAAGDIETPGEELPPGRFFLATRPTWLTLHGVSFVLMPWPTLTQYPEATGHAQNATERAQALAKSFMAAATGFDLPKDRPAVLVAHIQTSGIMVGSASFRIDDRDNITVDAGPFAEMFDYVALGHIHKPQSIGGHEHIRYSGSIERLDLGEKDDAKSCVVFELNSKGMVGPPRLLPLPATTVDMVTIHDPDIDVPRWQADKTDHTRDLINYFVRYDPLRQKLDQVLSDLAAVFPRWYARSWEDMNATLPSVEPKPPTPQQSMVEIVREYVAKQIKEQPPEDQKEFEMALEELLTKEAA